MVDDRAGLASQSPSHRANGSHVSSVTDSVSSPGMNGIFGPCTGRPDRWRGDATPLQPGRGQAPDEANDPCGGPLVSGVNAMSDDKSKPGPDRHRVSLEENYEVLDWCKSLGCTEGELREAVGHRNSEE
jgi:hypothetical protein